jgi:hypothetical protein
MIVDPDQCLWGECARFSAFVTSIIAMILAIVAVATPSWYKASFGGITVHAGLGYYCVESSFSTSCVWCKLLRVSLLSV